LFASSYIDLYTSVPYNEHELMKLTEEIDVRVKQDGFTIVTALSVLVMFRKLSID